MTISYLSGGRIQGVLGAKTPAEIGSVYEHWDCSQQVSTSAWNDQEGSNNLTVDGCEVTSAGQNGYDHLQYVSANTDYAYKSSGRTSNATGSNSIAFLVNFEANSVEQYGQNIWRSDGASGDYTSVYLSKSGNAGVTGTYNFKVGTAADNTISVEDNDYIGEWIAIIVTYTHGGKMRLYMGRAGEATSLKATGTNDYDPTDNTVGLGTKVSIGKNGDNNNTYFGGKMAECITFNKSLSAAEAGQLGAHLLYKWGVTSTEPLDEKASLLNNGVPTTTVDFSSDPLTSSSTEVSYNATTDKIDYDLQGSDTGGGRGTIDFGASVGASWVIDFDINDTAVTNNHSARLCNFFGMATNNVDMTSVTALAGTLGVSSDIDPDGSRDRYELIASSTGNYQSTDYITDADTIDDNDHWYVRMTKDGSADTFKVDYYTTSTRTGSPAHTVTISGVTFDDLRYFGVWDSADSGGTNRQVGNISEIKFYNNTTTVPIGTPIQSTFEETNTRKQFTLLYANSFSSAPSWIEMGTGGVIALNTTLNASICTGGYNGSNVDTTETFSGGIFTNSYEMTGTRSTHACGGTSTSAMAVGGDYEGSNSTSTEKLVGGSWASSVALPTIRYYTCGGGTVDDFLVGQGNSDSSVRNTSLEFNGTSWTNSATLSWSAYGASMGGNTSSAVEFSGYLVTNTATYNGSSWTDATAMNTARYNAGGDGNTTSAIAYSGANTQNCEKRDTTTWTSIGNTAGSGAIGSPVACGQGIGAICGWGKQSGVRLTSSQIYDGTAFSSSGTVNAVRENAAGSYST